MARDPRALLWDVREAADAIERFSAGLNETDYAANDLVRAAVERQFEIIGEALNQLSRQNPSLAGSIPHLADIVAFRNVLIHGYATVDHVRVWRIRETELPELAAAVAVLLDDHSAP